jgi:phage terminase large subunit
MGSVGQVDSVVGRSYDLIIFDECALNDDGKDAFNIQLRPTLDKLTSKAIFISTPRGKNWFYEFYKRGYDEEFPTWASIKSTYKDNPRAIESDVADAKASMSKAEFAQEFEADFVALEGQVYSLSRENVITVKKDELHIYDVIAGIDLGFRDPTAMCTILTDGYNYYVVDEFLKNEETTAAYARRIQQQIDDHDIDFIYIDSASQQTRFDLAMEYDISTVNAKKSVLDGIGYVASIVDHNRLFVDKECTHVIDMLDNYRWDPREGLLKERPLHDEYSHMADALRYALYTHSNNMVELGETVNAR